MIGLLTSDGYFVTLVLLVIGFFVFTERVFRKSSEISACLAVVFLVLALATALTWKGAR